MAANQVFIFLIVTSRLKLLKVIDIDNPGQQEDREETCGF